MRDYAGLLRALLLFTIASAGIAETTVYKVGVENLPFLPYSNAKKGGEYEGYFKDLLLAFQDDYNENNEKDIEFTFHPNPIKRLLAMFLKGKLDFKVPANSYWKKDSKKGHTVLYSKPLVTYTDGILVHRSLNSKIKTIEDLKEFGTVRGFTPWAFSDEVKSGVVQVKEFDDSNGLIKQGLLKRMRGIYFNEAVANHLLKKLGRPGELVLSTLKNPKSTYHMATIHHKKILDAFDIYLESLINRKEISDLKKKHNLSNY